MWKRSIKVLVSILYWAGDSLRHWLRRMVGRQCRGTCVVLYYHGVRYGQRAQFAHQMEELMLRTKAVRADMEYPLAPGVHHAAVTFDDGFQSVIENALPELEKRKIPATIFVVTDALGQFPKWDDFSSGADWQEVVMSADQLRKIPSDLVTIGSHTMTHPTLSRHSIKEVRRELSESRARLEGILKKEVKLLSFPYGAFNEKLLDWCREAGYERVFTTSPILAFSEPREFVTGRVRAEPTDWRLEFRLKLLGAYRWPPLAFALKRKLLSLSPLAKIRRARLSRLEAESQDEALRYVANQAGLKVKV